MKRIVLIMLLLVACSPAYSQIDVVLYEQFNGRYDFTFAGNTLNTHANTGNDLCEILTTSSAGLALAPDDTIIAALLYWAGSGAGDYTVTLNGQEITASRQFPVMANNTDGITRPFFSAFADVTALVQATGNGTYTLAELDLTGIINDDVPSNQNLFCQNGTNFGGWSLLVVYENTALPLNQINVYDGLQFVPEVINITLPSLNVIDNMGARIGFIAWEGDQALSNNETLRINGELLSNALNPEDNAFNSTNSVTGSTSLFNMDLDIYEIQDHLEVGDETAEIQLTSSADFVMVSTIVTKLNSQLPDATIVIDGTAIECNSRTIVVDYTVYNVNSTDALPAGTPIAIYLDGELFETAETTAELPIGGSESATITLTLPDTVTGPFQLLFVVDDAGDGTGTVTETDETNNTAVVNESVWVSPVLEPADITSCDVGFGSGRFDFSHYEQELQNAPGDEVTFYLTQEDAVLGQNNISNTSQFSSTSNLQEIFVRLFNGNCFITGSFLLQTKKCKPTTYNYVTPNGDGINDSFFVEGLRNVFLNFKLSIYNRWGNLVWTGNNSTEDWDGIADVRKVGSEGTLVPESTYYFVLELNDPDFPEPIVDWVYVTK